MKNSELFDILGEIDDKYFEEAKQPDVQHGELIVAESSPFRSFMSIFAPIAACAAIVAAVVIGANFVGRNAGIVGPNDSDSVSDVPLSSDSSTVSEPESSVSSSESESSVPPVNNNEIRIEDYPPIDLETVPDIKGSGLETQTSQQDKLLQKATLATLKCGEYELYMLGRFIHTDKSEQDELYSCKLYSYYVTLALSKNGKVISDDSTHTRSVSMGQGGYVLDAEQLSSYLEYYEFNGTPLIIFKYPSEIYPGSIGYEATFFSIADDKLVPLMGDYTAVSEVALDMGAELTPSYKVDENSAALIDGGLIYRFNCGNFDKNPYDNAPHYTVVYKSSETDVIELAEYPRLDVSQIPDVGDDPYDITNAIPKALIAETSLGRYTFSLVGENIRTSYLFHKDESDNDFMADHVAVMISRDDKLIIRMPVVGTGVSSMFISPDNLTEYLPKFFDFAGGIAIMTDDREIYTIKNDELVEMKGTFSDAANKYMSDGLYLSYGLSPIPFEAQNKVILYGKLEYAFDFDNLTYNVTHLYDDLRIDLSDYKLYDPEYGTAEGEVQPKVILDEKDFGGYKFYLLGHDVQNMFNDGNHNMAAYSELYIAIEKDGAIVDKIKADNTSDLIRAEFDRYLQPFEMKDGIGFVMYYDLDANSHTNYYAMIYTFMNDTITKITYEHDYGPAPATGSPMYIGGVTGITSVPGENAFETSNRKIVIDIINNKYSIIE